VAPSRAKSKARFPRLETTRPHKPGGISHAVNQTVELGQTRARAFLCHAPPKNGKSSIKPLDDFDTPWEVAPRVATLTLATLFGKFSWNIS
jgi:hypothetical protein